MKTSFFHFVLCLIVGCLYVANSRVVAAPMPSVEDFCGVVDYKLDNRNYARSMMANLNVGELRTVRLIHFIPNERVSSGNVSGKMKTAILEAQRFYTEQTRKIFKIEMDSSDQPKVHRVIGQHPRSYYRDKHYRKIFDAVWDEIKQKFHLGKNIYLVVLDNDSHLIGNVAGAGGQSGKNGGMALVAEEFTWEIVAHELGHAFGLQHNFHDNEYIMSSGGGEHRSLSDCNARFLNVHPYFNTRIPTREEDGPTIELISEDAYPAGAAGVSINLKISDSDQIHQVLLFVKTKKPHPSAGFLELIDCSRYGGFWYDGNIPSTRTSQLSDTDWHRVYVRAIDVDGDIGEAAFTLSEIDVSHITAIESDDNDIRALSFSPSGHQLAVQGDNIHVWNNAQPSWHLPALRLICAIKDLSKYVASGCADGRVSFTYSYGNMLWDLPFNLQTPILDKDTSAFFSNDGRRLASISRASPDAIELWDTTTGEHIRTIEHKHYMNRMLFSPDATILAWEGPSIYLWDVATGERITTIMPNPMPHGFQSLAFSPNGSILAARQYDGQIVKLWNVVTGENLLSFSIEGDYRSSRNPIVFSPDGATLAIIDAFGLCLWDVAIGSELARIKGIYGETPVAFSPDGLVIASGKSSGSDNSDGKVELWDVSKWTKPRPHNLVKIAGDNQQGAPGVRLPNPLVVQIADLNGEPYSGAEVTFTITLGAGRLNQRFTSIKTTTDFNGQAECSLTLGPYSGTNAVDVSMGKRKFVTFRAVGVEAPDAINMEGDYRMWGLPAGARIRVGKGGVGTSHKAVAFSPDGQNFAVASQIGIWLYDAATARELALFPTEYVAKSVWFSPDGATIMSAAGWTINQWNVETGEKITRWENKDNFIKTFSSDGKIAVSIYVNQWTTPQKDPKIIEMWDAETGEKVNTLEGHTSQVYNVVFSPDGQLLASYAMPVNPRVDARIKLWHVATGKDINTLENIKRAVSRDKPYPIAFSPDGRTLVVGNTLWDVDTGQNIRTLNIKRITALAFSSDGKTLATAYNMIHLWNVDTGENIGILEGHLTWNINSLSFSPDGNSIVSASSAGGVAKLWDIKTQMFLDLGHVKYTSFFFSPDSTILATESYQNVHLWNVKTGENIAAFEASHPSAWFSQDGSMLAIISNSNVADGIKVLWDIETQTQITASEIVSSVSRPSDEQWIPPNMEVNVDGRNQTIELLDKETGDIIATLENIGEYFYRFFFSPDGNLLAIVSSDGVKLWDISANRITTILGTNNYLADVTFSSSGETLAINSGYILLWDMEVLNSRFTPLAPASVNLNHTLQTELLTNYPNPFNPETWIPFRLAQDAKVTLTIYDVGGRMVRTLDIGHSKTGIYESRDKAIYWDGRNDLGENVASGVYFYNLMAGGYSATRRMVILK